MTPPPTRPPARPHRGARVGWHRIAWRHRSWPGWAMASRCSATEANCSPMAGSSSQPAPYWPAPWPWPPEGAAARQSSMAKSERARENRAYVRRLLMQRQPEFAAALASAEHAFPCPDGPGERRNQDDDRAADIPFLCHSMPPRRRARRRHPQLRPERRFATYLGSLIGWGIPLTLFGETAEQVATATGSPRDWAGDEQLASFPRATFAALARVRHHRKVVILDIRRLEWRDGHQAGAVHLPLRNGGRSGSASARSTSGTPDTPAPGASPWVLCPGAWQSYRSVGPS